MFKVSAVYIGQNLLPVHSFRTNCNQAQAVNEVLVSGSWRTMVIYVHHLFHNNHFTDFTWELGFQNTYNLNPPSKQIWHNLKTIWNFQNNYWYKLSSSTNWIEINTNNELLTEIIFVTGMCLYLRIRVNKTLWQIEMQTSWAWCFELRRLKVNL